MAGHCGLTLPATSFTTPHTQAASFSLSAVLENFQRHSGRHSGHVISQARDRNCLLPGDVSPALCRAKSSVWSDKATLCNLTCCKGWESRVRGERETGVMEGTQENQSAREQKAHLFKEPPFILEGKVWMMAGATSRDRDSMPLNTTCWGQLVAKGSCLHILLVGFPKISGWPL